MPFIITIILFFSISLQASQIEYVISEISPHLNEKKISKYAKIIDRYSEYFDVEWEVAVAIFKQESDFIHGEIDAKYRDFGIGQINWTNIKARKLNLAKLLTNEEYAFKITFEMLKELKTKYNTNSRGHWRWFTRYNSYTPSVRRKYFYGRLKSGRDGLKHKLDKIEDLKIEYTKKFKSFSSRTTRSIPNIQRIKPRYESCNRRDWMAQGYSL